MSLGAVWRNASGTVTSIDPYRRCFEVKLDGSDTSKRIAIDNSPEIETEYAMWHMLLKKRRRRRELEQVMLVNPQAFQQSQRPDDVAGPDYFRWSPTRSDSPTIFSTANDAHTNLSSLSEISFNKVSVYQQTNQLYQQQAAWHQRVQQTNQTTHWSHQQAQYLNEIGHTRTQSLSQSKQF